ncbi:MAG: hypothetical protein CML39_00640 [Rhodobacteraceae bacterium]|nr:MAG: hypothetical protein CML39_00640 [Paracoccaceae bacterium]
MKLLTKNMVLGYLFLAILIILSVIIAFWLLVPNFLEKPKFKLVISDGPIQVRNYDTMISAQISAKGKRYDGLRAGFIPLARYIGAKDRDGAKISMTAPVMQQMDVKSKSWAISFFMPSKYTLNQLPKAENNNIVVSKIAPKQMAVISFNGVANKDLLGQKLFELKEWIESSAFVISGNPEPVYAYYNDPSTPGIFRKNEIMLLVRQKN